MTAPVDTYPPPNRPSVAPSPVVPTRPLLALRRPPPATAPPHPPRPDLPPPPAGYTRTLHAAPAAWPKQLRESVGTCSRGSDPFAPGPIPAKESKEARAARIEEEKNTSLTRRHAATEWDIKEAERSAQPPQWLASERWRRDKPVPGGVTLVFAHANGLQKEVSRMSMGHALIMNCLTVSANSSSGTRSLAVCWHWSLCPARSSAPESRSAGTCGLS